MICDANEIELNDSLGKEMRSDSIVDENLAALPTEDWWDMACQISCLSCHSKNIPKITNNKLTCRECENCNMLLSLAVQISQARKDFLRKSTNAMLTVLIVILR